MKILSSVISSLLVVVWILLGAALAQASNNPTWFDHPDFMQVLIGALFAAVLGLFIRAVKKIDSNQTRLFERLDNLCDEFYVLKGEHNARKNHCPN